MLILLLCILYNRFWYTRGRFERILAVHECTHTNTHRYMHIHSRWQSPGAQAAETDGIYIYIYTCSAAIRQRCTFSCEHLEFILDLAHKQTKQKKITCARDGILPWHHQATQLRWIAIVGQFWVRALPSNALIWALSTIQTAMHTQ